MTVVLRCGRGWRRSNRTSGACRRSGERSCRRVPDAVPLVSSARLVSVDDSGMPASARVCRAARRQRRVPTCAGAKRMALTEFQRSVCRLIARSRVASGESYVAVGAALNEALAAPRLSRNVDLFHDTESALDASWSADRRLLEENGFEVRPVRERRSFVEAEVSRERESVLLQWVKDSAFRFSPSSSPPISGSPSILSTSRPTRSRAASRPG